MEITQSKTNPEFHDYQEFLAAEYNYIAQTAFQANEDRSRSSQFFLITFGTFLAALFSSQYNNIDLKQLYLAFAAVFGTLAFFGALTVLQITRLRQAWIESIRAMNFMKDALISENPSLSKCFHWNTGSIPSALKIWSIGFLMSLQVSLISGFAIGTAVAFVGLAVNNSTIPWLLCIGIGILSSVIYLLVFNIYPLCRSK
jgi:hypothetical protein